MPMRYDIFKIIAPSCVNNYLVPHIRILMCRTLLTVKYVDFNNIFSIATIYSYLLHYKTSLILFPITSFDIKPIRLLIKFFIYVLRVFGLIRFLRLYIITYL